MNAAVSHSGIWIPIVAILATFAVPIVAIIMDFRRRRLQFEERRAMIERGMQLPPQDDDGNASTPEERREATLKNGLIMLFLGVGLGLGAYLLLYVLTDTFIPHRLAGPMALGASIVGFIGLGNLVYYAASRPRVAP